MKPDLAIGCNKIKYRTKGAARKALQALKAEGLAVDHYYACTACFSYHLTSHRRAFGPMPVGR